MFGLAGRAALVTGGNGGIGLGIAEGLANAGASVAIAARDMSKTERAVEGLSESGSDVIGLQIDVADEDSVDAAVATAVERFGRLDILVNNAGIAVRNQPQEYSVGEWDQVLDVNLKGTFLCARAVYPHMVEAGGGSIVNIGSMTSIFGSDWVSSYSASKGGVVQLTRSLAIAWAGKRYPRQHHSAGMDQDRADERVLDQSRQPGPPGAHQQPHTGRQMGRTGRPRRTGGVPFERRRVLRYRHGDSRRRRILLVLNRELALPTSTI